MRTAASPAQVRKALHPLPWKHSHLCSPRWSPPRCCGNHLTSVPLLPPCIPPGPRPAQTPTRPLAEGSGQALPSWKFHQGAEGKAPVSLRQKRLWRFCLFSLDTFMQGDAIGESHGVNIMLVCRFLRHTDSGRSFAQQ